MNSKINELKPVEKYLCLQGRFRHLGAEQREEFQRYVEKSHCETMRRLEFMSRR